MTLLSLQKLMQKPKFQLKWKNFGARPQTKSSYKVFFAETALKIARENNINIVLSGTVVDDNVQPCRAIINHEEHVDIELLKSSIEEADSRIIDYSSCKLECYYHYYYHYFVILSNDTLFFDSHTLQYM